MCARSPEGGIPAKSLSAAQAVEKLMRAYGKLVFHTIYGLTGDREESQDLTQDTFLQAVRAIDAARAHSGADFHAKAWLLRIAVNTGRMRLRRTQIMRFIPFSRLREERQEEMGTSTELLSKQTDPVQPAGFGATAIGDPAEVVAERDALRRAMAQLPEAQRLCLLLAPAAGLCKETVSADLCSGEWRSGHQRNDTCPRGKGCVQRSCPASKGEDSTPGPRESYTVRRVAVC
jgi:RNA polymerase sigma factor (sigma-70 family)